MELQGKRCEYDCKGRFAARFDELQNKADSCNNVATLQNIKVEADALKVRLLNEIVEEEAKYIEVEVENDDDPPIKKSKTISIKTVTATASWQLETIEDVEEYLKDFRKKLIGTLEDDTIIHIEF